MKDLLHSRCAEAQLTPRVSPKAARATQIGTSNVPLRGLGLALAAAMLLSSAGPAFAAASRAPSKDQVVKLIAVLQSGAPQKEKADACRELARIGTKEAVAPLAALLGDDKLSHMARYGLETIPDSSVDKALRAALDKLDGRNLVGVIGSIGVRRDAKAVKPLSKRLRDPDPDVAQAAARALGKIGNAAAADAIQTALPGALPANQLAFCEGLFRCAESLSAKGSRKQALAIYDRLRGMQLPHQARLAALRGAVLNRGKDGLPLLLESLGNSDFALSAAAMRISLEMPGSNVTAALAMRLKTLPQDQQILLAQTLGKRGDRAALPWLFDAAKGTSQPVRLAAIRALPEIGHPAAVPVLVELMKDSDLEIAKAAQEGLASLPGREADAAVMNMLARGAVGRRITAMDLIVRRRMTFAIPQIFASTEDFEPKIRVAAVKKLGELAGPDEIPAVLRLLEKAKTTDDLEAAEQALNALSQKASDPQAGAVRLAAQLPRLRPAQQCVVLRVLAAVGGTNAQEAVHAAISSHEPEVHAAAVRALSSWSTVDAAPELLELARFGGGSTDQTLCLRGYLRLAALPDVPADKRLSMCREAAKLPTNGDEKKLLLAALGGIHSVASLELIQPYLEDPTTKDEAVAASTDIAEKLLEGKDAAKLAPKLVPVLEKAAGVADKESVTKRVNSLLSRAKAKAGEK